MLSYKHSVKNKTKTRWKKEEAISKFEKFVKHSFVCHLYIRIRQEIQSADKSWQKASLNTMILYLLYSIFTTLPYNHYIINIGVSSTHKFPSNGYSHSHKHFDSNSNFKLLVQSSVLDIMHLIFDVAKFFVSREIWGCDCCGCGCICAQRLKISFFIKILDNLEYSAKSNYCRYNDAIELYFMSR